VNQLAETQSLLQAAILTGERAIEREIQGLGDEFRRARLSIYRDAYRLRLLEVLSTDYQALRKYLGAESFDAAALEYLAAYPSTFRNVRWFGANFSEFLKSASNYAQHPWLAELAQFEWTLGLAFDAAETESVPFEEVAAVPVNLWPEMRFLASASLHLIDLGTNAVTIWKEIDTGNRSQGQISAQPVTWVIWRKDHTPFFRSLDRDEAWALVALLAGENFAHICGGLCQWVPEQEAAARAAGMLRTWVNEGWVAKLCFGND
jgi:hypothetical protein